MRALPLLALALSPPVTCTSLLLTRSTSPLASSVPGHREELDMQWQLVPQSREDVAPEGLVPPRPALPEGPEAGGAGGAGIKQAGPLHQQLGLPGQLRGWGGRGLSRPLHTPGAAPLCRPRPAPARGPNPPVQLRGASFPEGRGGTHPGGLGSPRV